MVEPLIKSVRSRLPSYPHLRDPASVVQSLFGKRKITQKSTFETLFPRDRAPGILTISVTRWSCPRSESHFLGSPVTVISLLACRLDSGWNVGHLQWTWSSGNDTCS